MRMSSRSDLQGTDGLAAWWRDTPAPISNQRDVEGDAGKLFDLIVIGSGIIGLSTAFRTVEQQPGIRVLVLSANPSHECNTPLSFGILTPMLYASPRTWSRLVGAQKARAGYRALHDLSRELVARGLAHEGTCQIDLGRSELPLEPYPLLQQYADLGVPAQLSRELAPGAIGPAIDLNDHAFCDPRALLSYFQRTAQARGVRYISSVVDRIAPTSTGYVVNADTGDYKATRVVKAVGARTLTGTAIPGAQRHASVGALLLPTAAAPNTRWQGLLADAGKDGLHARVRADNSVILGFSAPVENHDDAAARQLALDRTLTEARRRYPHHVVDQTWSGWVYKGDGAVAATRMGSGDSLDLWACQGRGLLVGMALGQHAAHIATDTHSSFVPCFGGVAPTPTAEEKSL